MQKILLLSESIATAKKIKVALEANLPQSVAHFLREEDMLRNLRSHSQLLILDTSQFEQTHFGLLQKARERGYSAPTLALADSLLYSNFYENRDKYLLHFMEKPFEEKSLIGLVRKLLLAKRLPQQMFRRYRTQQAAEIEPLVTGGIYNSSVFNLSRGGAYCEFSEDPSFSVGDLVRLNVQLTETSSQYNLSAKVVWKTKKGRFTGRNGAGFKFMKSEDIYKYLLERV